MVIYFLLLLFPAFLSAHGIQNISGDLVKYDKKKIIIDGSCHIVSSFAEVTAEKGVLIFDTKDEKKQTAKRMLFHGAVKMILQDGSTVTSDEADIDLVSLIGVFTSKTNEKVCYITRMKEQNGSPIKTTSRQIKVTMKQESSTKEYVVEDMQSEGAVRIESLEEGPEEEEAA